MPNMAVMSFSRMRWSFCCAALKASRVMDRGLKAARSDFRPAIRAGGSGQLGRDGLADESDDALAIGML